MYNNSKIEQLISDYYYVDETYINPHIDKTKADDKKMLRLVYLLSKGDINVIVKFNIDMDSHKTIMNIFTVK